MFFDPDESLDLDTQGINQLFETIPLRKWRDITMMGSKQLEPVAGLTCWLMLLMDLRLWVLQTFHTAMATECKRGSSRCGDACARRFLLRSPHLLVVGAIW